MLNICLTFDYELFFGKNFGSANEILFEPTEKLLGMLHDEGVSATFFADTCSVAQNQKYQCIDYVRGFSEQIVRMIKLGQDVQLHIHPHWLTSDYSEEQWQFDSSHYRLQSFGFDETKRHNAYSIIAEGKEYLEATLKAADPSYQCIAYRAGGFTFQPHKELIAALKKNGMEVDSSIAPHLVSRGVNSYDYDCKLPYVNWNISSDGEWWEDRPDTKNSLFEIPVATENKNITFAVRRLLKPNSIKLNLGKMRGTYIKGDNDGTACKVDIIDYLTGYSALSMDAYRAKFIFGQLKRFARKNNCNKKNCAIALIGHPKLVTDVYVENLRTLIKLIKSNSNMTIKSITQAYHELKG